jgi:hypothetical protein
MEWEYGSDVVCEAPWALVVERADLELEKMRQQREDAGVAGGGGGGLTSLRSVHAFSTSEVKDILANLEKRGFVTQHKPPPEDSSSAHPSSRDSSSVPPPVSAVYTGLKGAKSGGDGGSGSSGGGGGGREGVPVNPPSAPSSPTSDEKMSIIGGQRQSAQVPRKKIEATTDDRISATML